MLAGLGEWFEFTTFEREGKVHVKGRSGSWYRWDGKTWTLIYPHEVAAIEAKAKRS